MEINTKLCKTNFNIELSASDKLPQQSMPTSNSKQNLSEAACGASAPPNPSSAPVTNTAPSGGGSGIGGGAGMSESTAKWLRIFYRYCVVAFTGAGSSGSSGPHLLSAANHLEIPSNNPNLLSPDILNQRRGI